MMKKLLTVFLALAMAGSVFAGGSKDSGKAQEPSGPKQVTVAVVLPSPLGDRSFCDSAAEGVRRANAELPVKVDLIETQGVHEHETAMRSAINKGYDLILGVGLDTQMMLDLAAEYPNQTFGSPSELFADKLPDNLASLLINVNKSSFLAGLAVGTLTKTGKVGAVCGGDAPGINQFFYGFKQGVLVSRPDARVYVNYLGFDFSNPTLGKESAIALFDEGCDIIYQVAGLSGEGVLAAAAERKLYAIGVDNVQDEFYPGSIILSVIKRVDNSTYNLIEDYVKGTYRGGFRTLDIEDGATGISWDTGADAFEKNGPADMVAKLPEIKTRIDSYRSRILSGEYKVYDALTEPLWDNLK
ncbi:MAG: BMP family ABC transporter substrate-binding protein [Spirochaetaceae bacterium]|jgi:basic membrane protein A|nr:BMP family ABC transporter substrate-binding protein [Spirochaetaceae bacterium]